MLRLLQKTLRIRVVPAWSDPIVVIAAFLLGFLIAIALDIMFIDQQFYCYFD